VSTAAASLALVLATLAAIADVCVRLHRAARRREAWASLDQVRLDLVGMLDENGILRSVLAHTLTMFGCEAVTVVLYPQPGRDGLIASVSSGYDAHASLLPLADTQLPTDIPSGAVQTALAAAGKGIGHLTVHGAGRGGRRTQRRLLAAVTHQLTGALLAARMYDAHRQSAEDAHRQTLRDNLTGLGNRALLEQQGPCALAAATAGDRSAALLLLDLNDFKRVNDTLGHEAGDHVLTEVGSRIMHVIRKTDLAVRLGGDEFAILVTDLRSAADAERVAGRVLQVLARPVSLDDVELTVHASIGLAMHAEAGTSLASLLRSADRAMYQAKAVGDGRWHRAARRSLAGAEDSTPTGDELRCGLDRDEIVAHYQPQVDAEDGRVLGFEALARWQHPQLGLLPPETFVPLAERSGLMRKLLSTVLDQAVRDHVRLRRLAPASTVSVNVAPRNLLDQGLVADVEQTLHRYAASAAQLTLEIAEPPSPSPSPSAAAVLTALEALGCTVSVEEFGTGRSSLTALTGYRAIRELKVAPALTGAVLVDPAARRLVQALVHTAHGLGVRVVGEGAESAELAVSLRELGCDRLQGIHVLAPVTVVEIEAWLADRDRLRVPEKLLDSAVG
jgi:diguanylate cyclase (GGDEF)-like protein